MAAIQLALKVDVCTHAGMQHGVLALMRLFDALGVRGSFFVACGPDHSGRAIRRIFRPGFLGKMARTNAVGTYGWRTLLYGTLLPGPQIARSAAATMRHLIANGHEVAMHGYDHVYWQDRLPGLTPAAVRAELDRACATYSDITGAPPRAFGAPGWQCTLASLQGEDRLGLAYHSDTRGTTPYLPEMDGQRCTTLEIPTTLPTLDEAYGRAGTTARELTPFYRDQLRPGLNVHTVHAEMEGVRHQPLLQDLLATLRGEVEFVQLQDVAAALQNDRAVPVCRVAPRRLPGRAGTVACQEIAHV